MNTFFSAVIHCFQLTGHMLEVRHYSPTLCLSKMCWCCVFIFLYKPVEKQNKACVRRATDAHAQTPWYTTHRLGPQGSRLPSSIHPGLPTPILSPDKTHLLPLSGDPALMWTCGGLLLQRLGPRCPNFPLYTQIICAWVMQTEGSSKCMWTRLMASANWSWNRALGSGMAAVQICTVAIHQRD